MTPHGSVAALGCEKWVVALAVEVAFDEVPEGVGHEVCGLSVIVVEGVDLEDAEACGVVAASGKAHHLA